MSVFLVFGQDASIPRCANGTNLLIPLPGPIRDEDIAITGAGARLHEKDTSSLSLLYDFEELEGQLDFLTRVVSVTFYPAGSLKIPMTLGQVITTFWTKINDLSNSMTSQHESKTV